MSRAVRYAVALAAGLALAGGGSSLVARARAVPASTGATAPPPLVNAYPLGSQRLCCQSRTASQKATPRRTTGPPQGETPSAHHTSSGSGKTGLSVLIWAVLAVGAVLLAGSALAISRMRHRLSGLTAPTAKMEPSRPEPAGVARRAGAVTNGWGHHEPVEHLMRSAGRASAGATEDRAPAEGGTSRSSASQPVPMGVGGARPTDAGGAEPAELAYRRADGAGDAGGAFNLGVLLHQRRDLAAAAAYERAELRGDRDAAFNLGILLYEQGDLDGAEAAWRRCMSRRHAQAAANLAFLLRRRGDLEGAQKASAAAETWADPGSSESANSQGAPSSARMEVHRL